MSAGKFVFFFALLTATVVSMVLVWRDPDGGVTAWMFPWWWRKRPLRRHQVVEFRAFAAVYGGLAPLMLIVLIADAAT